MNEVQLRRVQPGTGPPYRAYPPDRPLHSLFTAGRDTDLPEGWMDG